MRIYKIVTMLLLVFLLAGLSACDLISGLFGNGEPRYATNVVLVDAHIIANATWLDGKVYVVTTGVHVSQGVTLTINAGAIVKFTADGSLYIDNGGTIKANGSATKKIVFTSIKDTAAGGDSLLSDVNTIPAKGDWNYVWTGIGSNSNVFTYCEFRYAGKDKNAALYINGQTTVDHCVFHDNLCGLPSGGVDEATLDAGHAATGTVITYNTFYNNLWPLAIPETMSLDDSNTFEFDHDSNAATPSLKNTHQAIFVFPNANVAGHVRWQVSEVPLCVFDDIGVDNGGTLEIDSSVRLKFSGKSSGINVFEGGTLTRNAAIFTSYRDDTVLGDTNADGTASGPAPDDWDGIWEWTSGGGHYLTDTNIKYAANPQP